MTTTPPLLPPQRDPRQPEPGAYYHAYPPAGDDLTLSGFVSIVRRHRLLVVLCIVVTVALVAAYTFHSTPVYDATSVLQFEPEQVNLPQLLQELTSENEIGTGIEVLQGRSVAVSVIDSLGLRAAVAAPRGARPTKLFGYVKVAPGADTATLVLEAQGAGRFTVRREGAAGAASAVAGKLGDTVQVAGVKLAPLAAALAAPEVKLRVASMDQAVRRFESALKVDRPSRDADLISVRYRGPDPVQATAAANLLAVDYIASRQEVRTASTGSTVNFLRQQLDTLGVQLHEAEDALRAYQEETGLVDAEEQARTQVGRLVQIEAERGSVGAERQALATLLEQMRSDSTRGYAAGEAPASRLISFPTLFRNQAASELLGALAQVQNQRSELMTRRTADDPDVQVLTARIRQIDAQLQSIAETYLQGLADQEMSLNVVARRFGTVLNTLPAEEVETARLEREVKVRQDLYTLLQTRLKESQITQAMVDPTVHIVDAAAVPERSVRPNKPLNLALGLVLGCLLALSAALVRELSDRAVRSRTDTTLASGLPILGALPRLRRGRRALPGSEWRLVASPRDQGGGHRVLMAPKPNGKRGSGRGSKKGRVLITLPDAPVAYAEALNQLQANLALNYRERPLKVVVFTSPLPGEGKTLTSVNFALMLAGRGVKVLLVDADLRCGLVNEVFGSRRRPGFAELLSGAAGFDDAVRRVSVGEKGKLAFLPSGGLTSTPGRLPDMARVREVLDGFSPDFDVVLIDSPPINLLSDAALLGAVADAVLLVVRAGHTHVEALRYAMDRLTTARVPVIGTLLNDIDPKRSATYDGSYRYLTDIERYYVAGNGHDGHGG